MPIKLSVYVVLGPHSMDGGYRECCNSEAELEIHIQSGALVWEN